MRDHYSCTLLMKAVMWDKGSKLDIINVLIKNGTDLNVRDGCNLTVLV